MHEFKLNVLKSVNNQNSLQLYSEWQQMRGGLMVEWDQRVGDEWALHQSIFNSSAFNASTFNASTFTFSASSLNCTTDLGTSLVVDCSHCTPASSTAVNCSSCFAKSDTAVNGTAVTCISINGPALPSYDDFVKATLGSSPCSIRNESVSSCTNFSSVDATLGSSSSVNATLGNSSCFVRTEERVSGCTDSGPAFLNESLPVPSSFPERGGTTGKLFVSLEMVIMFRNSAGSEYPLVQFGSKSGTGGGLLVWHSPPYFSCSCLYTPHRVVACLCRKLLPAL